MSIKENLLEQEEKEGVDKLKSMTYTEIYYNFDYHKECLKKKQIAFDELVRSNLRLLTAYEKDIEKLKSENTKLSKRLIELEAERK